VYIRMILVILCLSMMGFQGPGRKIVNTPTTKHLEIGRSGLSIIPPSGFAESRAVRGFENAEKQAQITAGQLSFPFATISQGLKEEMKGDHVRILESLSFNEYDALLVKHLEKSQDGVSPYRMVIMLVFGDRYRTWQVSSVYPANHDGELGLALEKALLTTVQIPDDNLEDEAVMETSYGWFGKMGINPGRLKLANKLGASILFFNLDGRIPSQSQEDVSFNISRYNGTKSNPKDVSLQKIHALNPQDPPVASSVKEIEIAGMKGFEITAYIGEGEKKSLIYQVTLFGDLNYYRLLGRAETNHDARIQEFRTISETFKVR